MAEIPRDPEYDVIIILNGHSSINVDTPQFLSIPNGYKITTFLPADPGIGCFSDKVSLLQEIKECFEASEQQFQDGNGYYGECPQLIFDAINSALKPQPDEPCFSRFEQSPEWQKFIQCKGAISKQSTIFYNKSWSFNQLKEGVHDAEDFIVMITKQPDRGVVIQHLYEEKIAQGNFVLTKAELLSGVFSGLGFTKPLFIDISCSDIIGTPENARRFTEFGAFGGKRKKRKTRKYRY